MAGGEVLRFYDRARPGHRPEDVEIALEIDRYDFAIRVDCPSREGIPLRGGLFRCTAGGDRWEALSAGLPQNPEVHVILVWGSCRRPITSASQARGTCVPCRSNRRSNRDKPGGFLERFRTPRLMEAKIVEEKASNTKQFQRLSD
jgi:hypothetical protein